MAVGEYVPVNSFEDWYQEYSGGTGRDGELEYKGFSPQAQHIRRQWLDYKREMDQRVHNYDKLEMLADNQVISPKPDLPNISSGETAGLIRRIARNLVQNTPNVDIVSAFDDDQVKGIFSKHILTQKIIGSDTYSNDMQQNLFSSVKTSFTLGFACVIPALLQDAANGWYIKYDTIHYRDVFPEPGAKDIRDATCVYVRRYLTKGEAIKLIRDEAHGWDIYALKLLVQNNPRAREMQSVDHQTKKHHQIPDGYEIITKYTNSGDNFVTFSGSDGCLLRIEKNKHPLKQHPVHFLVLEKDDQQPLGKSQVELILGRQEFQDLMLNGAMKLWYRNINPSIIGYGTVNSIPNLSPGKYTQISNPNAKIEPFEVNTQTLMQYGTISQQNLGSMVQTVGAADQQMAMQGPGSPGGMSATPQGVEAQTAMVDITTNNYQKAIESFFSHYCSYALTIYFRELASVKKVKLTADARQKLLKAGLPTEAVNDDNTLDIDYEDMAKEEFWVHCVPGSLTELEDEKQLRILNQMFIPLSQAMPAMAATQDQQMLLQAAKAMQYIIAKQIELSGSASAKDIGLLWSTGDIEQVNERDAKITALEESHNNFSSALELEMDMNTDAIRQLTENMAMMRENQDLLLEKLGVQKQPSETGSPTPEPTPEPERQEQPAPSTVY